MQSNKSIKNSLNTTILTIKNNEPVKEQPLRSYVEQAIKSYFAELGNDNITKLYELVLSEVEDPLLKTVLQRTAGNQSKAAVILGISRGTLRKKLKQYNLD